MLREDLQDAAEIVHTILHQPLSIPASRRPLSLVEAATHFNRSEAKSSDLRKILLSFLQFPEQTNIMLRELACLEKDLDPNS